MPRGTARARPPPIDPQTRPPTRDSDEGLTVRPRHALITTTQPLADGRRPSRREEHERAASFRRARVRRARSRRALVALLVGAVGVLTSSCSGVPSESPGAPTSTTVATDHAWTADDYASAVPQEMPMVEASSRPAPVVVTVGVVATSLVGVATAAWFLRQRRRS